MVQWNLPIPEDTQRSVRDLLSRRGSDNEDAFAAFVDQALRTEVLRQTIADIRERNNDLSHQDASQLAEEAVARTRANHT